MPERFSPAWIEALDAAARGLTAAAEPFVVQQVVTGPDGEVAWHLDLGPETIRVRVGWAESADVTFVQDRETARAVASGELSAGAALTSGRLTVRGATARLTEHRDVLARLDTAFQQVATDA
jgi:alkyl sulfatase BDS1-like metallo-beta-lactamase superfamily hydrolase